MTTIYLKIKQKNDKAEQEYSIYIISRLSDYEELLCAIANKYRNIQHHLQTSFILSSLHTDIFELIFSLIKIKNLKIKSKNNKKKKVYQDIFNNLIKKNIIFKVTPRFCKIVHFFNKNVVHFFIINQGVKIYFFLYSK